MEKEAELFGQAATFHASEADFERSSAEAAKVIDAHLPELRQDESPTAQSILSDVAELVDFLAKNNEENRALLAFKLRRDLIASLRRDMAQYSKNPGSEAPMSAQLLKLVIDRCRDEVTPHFDALLLLLYSIHSLEPKKEAAEKLACELADVARSHLSRHDIKGEMPQMEELLRRLGITSEAGTEGMRYEKPQPERPKKAAKKKPTD